MERPRYVCVRQERPGESGAAAASALARHHGLALSFPEVRSLSGLESLGLDLLQLLFVFRRLGFRAVPL
jgi:ABC-type bacteriocin/lantibiotic exporter with double-glycine peptidase domain